MRMLHTSDWHLGRSLHRADLRAAQAAFLDHLVEMVRAEQVDVVLVAGDVYDRAVPPVDAVELCEDALLRLHDTGAQHRADQRQPRLGAPARLRQRPAGGGRRAPAHPDRRGWRGRCCWRTRTGRWPCTACRTLEPDAVRAELPPETGTPGHAGVLGHAVRSHPGRRGRPRRAPPGGPGPRLGHRGSGQRIRARHHGRRSRPGRRRHFADFSYVALGHLHGQQTLAEQLRYSGSPLPYSFSEAEHRKGSWLVELDAAGVSAGRARSRARLPEAEPAPRPARGPARLARLHRVRARLRVGHAHRPGSSRGPDGRAAHPVPAHPRAHLRARGRRADARGYQARVAGRDDRAIAEEFVQHVRNTPPTVGERRLLAAAFEAVRPEEAG